MKRINARVKKPEATEKSFIMPEKYSDCCLEDAIIQVCSDSIFDILNMFGINVDDDSNNDIADMCIDLSNSIENYIRKEFNIPEDK